MKWAACLAIIALAAADDGYNLDASEAYQAPAEAYQAPAEAYQQPAEYSRPPCAHAYSAQYVPEGEYNQAAGEGYRTLEENDPACNPDYWKAYLDYVRGALVFLLVLLLGACISCCCCNRAESTDLYDQINDKNEPAQDYFGGVISKGQQDSSIRDAVFSGVAGQRTEKDNEIATRRFVANFFVWYGTLARYFVWAGGAFIMLAIAGLFLFMLVNEDNPALAASVSSYIQDDSTPQGKLFSGFSIVAGVMVLFSMFGFFVLPRWQQKENRGGCARFCCITELFSLCGICSPHRVYTRGQRARSWVLEEEGRVKIWWQVVATAFVMLVALIPVHTNRQELLRANKSANFVSTPADQITDQIHTAAAVFGCLLFIVLEMVQLIRGEGIFDRNDFHRTTNLQWARFASSFLALIFLIGYVVLGYAVGAPPPLPDGTPVYSSSQALGFVSEALAIALIGWDLILIGYIPTSANLDAFIYAGTSASTFDYEEDLTPAQKAIAQAAAFQNGNSML
jgi:hypothetical protein